MPIVDDCLPVWNLPLKCYGHTESHPIIPLIYMGGSANIIGVTVTFSISISFSAQTFPPYSLISICDNEILTSNNSKKWTKTTSIAVVVDDRFVHRFFAGPHHEPSIIQ